MGEEIDSTSGPRLSETMCSTLGGLLPIVATASSTNSASLSKREGAVVASLEADRRAGLEVDPGAAAERAAEVAGPDLGLLGQGQQSLVQGAEDVGGALARLDREVGAGDVADEEAVSGQRRPGIVAAGRVAEQERGVLGPVPGRVDRLDRRALAQRQGPAVAKCLVRVLGLGQLVDVNRGAAGAGEATVAGDVVGVVVGLQHVLDPHPVQAGEVQVGIDVPLRDRPPRRRRRRCRRRGRRRSRDPRG